MASAFVNRPHGDANVVMRPSRFLAGAMLAFAAVASASVFQCVFAHTEHAGHAAVACGVTLAALGLASYRWLRARPVALGLHSDGLTLRERDGATRHLRIAGYAQWSDRLLALTLCGARDRRETLLVPADSIDTDTFRQLAVQARRAAASHL
ncbi:lipoprotein [Caballeronia cordobensis]|uniref:Lipoprotein n=1 Tax=Caballeronia cordobensis TaxID=1353886 RepID=A0A158JBN3_CABCO|nr:protein YgfX [Caballeronia cordobensis]SAL65791.1 lipoprotein [Caballeronia cordobensis]